VILVDLDFRPSSPLGEFDDTAERGIVEMHVVDGAAQSRQKSLKRVVLNSVYFTVCWIERCPSQSWIARVSAPALAKA
jgi:hypothetical protein